MKDMRSIIHRKKALLFIIIAACILATLITTITVVYAADNEEVEYIYFDLSIGNVTITGNTYSGYAYKYDAETGIYESTEITGTLQSNQAYYVYQSYGGPDAPDGYFVLDSNGETKNYTIPTRTPVTHNDMQWEDYVTNNSDVEAVIAAWITAAPKAGRQSTGNRITVTGKVNAIIVIDDIWSSFQSNTNKSKTDGGFTFLPKCDDSKLTIQAKGDNRFGNIYYANSSSRNKTKLTFEEIESGSSITVANLNKDSNKNWWCAAIGGNDSGKAEEEHANGLIFNSGTIFAGTNAKDDCTAIGGGGNGYAHITINGGRITATVTSSGAAIGGGIGKSSNGGQADIFITGGEVYAYNFSCAYNSTYIPAAAIGGGSSAQSTCSECKVTITGGRVYAQSVGGTAIGGGSSTYKHGGTATVTIGGDAYVEAKSVAGTINKQSVPAGVAIGGGTGGSNDAQNGGNVVLKIEGNPTVIVGSIGGGKTESKTGTIGYATVTVTGGTIQGQIIMAQGSSANCSFTMSGGMIDNSRHDNNAFPFLQENGGVIYMDDSKGVANISGGTIIGANATNGGAIYMTNGQATISGTAIIQNCSATQNGGAIYMGGGELTVSGGEITSNTAINGAGAYLADGTMTVSGGTIIDNVATENGGAAYLGGGDLIVSDGKITSNKAINGAGAYLADGGSIMTVSDTAQIINNTASADGGAAYLAGGSFTMSGGTISGNNALNGAGAFVAGGNVAVSGGTIYKNIASKNGGAFYVSNGNYTMTGGTIDENYALSGDGGALYISSSQNNTQIVIRSGSIINNFAGNSGGALGIYGQDNVTFTISIGSNTNHAGKEEGYHEHKEDNTKVESCPILENNNALISGGGIYLSGSYKAIMNMYCIVEDEDNSNKVGNREDPNTFGVSDSNFMKVEGGTLNITTKDENDENNPNHGNVVISSSIHVTGGQVKITGSSNNPMFKGHVTVNVQNPTDFIDNRSEGDGARTIQYFEGFQSSGQYILIDETDLEDHIVRANTFPNHPGYTMLYWKVMEYKDGDYVWTGKTVSASQILKFDDPEYKGNLIFFAHWEPIKYMIEFLSGATGYIGSMASQSFELDTPQNLSPLGFKVKGERFVEWHWQNPPAGVQKTVFADGEEFTWPKELEITEIVFVATWKVCDHKDLTWYTFTSTTNSATRNCKCEAYTEYVILGGVTGVYQEDHHYEASVTHKPDFQVGGVTLWDVTVHYNGTSYGGNTLVDSTDAPINAGEYQASVKLSHNGEEVTLVADVIINKAERTQLPAVPEYDNVENQIVVRDPQDSTTLTLEYRFSWYDGSELVEENIWVKYNIHNDDLTDDTLPRFVMNEAWTNYAVEVRYAETDNYNASLSVKSGTYLFTGNVQIKITVGGEGHLVYTRLDPSESEGGITITLVPESSIYYIHNLSADINITRENGGEIEKAYKDPTILSKSIAANEWVVLVHDIQASPYQDEDIIIEISFVGGEAKVTTDTSTAKDEVFENIAASGENNVTISHDSAYTVFFDVKNFNFEHYNKPSIQFGSAIPMGTTIIMIDFEDFSYWAYTAQEATTNVELAEFVRMGDTQSFAPPTSRNSFMLQFVVNFANSSVPVEKNALETKFVATPKTVYAYYPMVQGVPCEINHIPEIAVNTSVAITEIAPSFSIEKMNTPSAEPLSQTISYQFAYNPDKNVGISKWNDLCGILVITPDDASILPLDTRLKVVIGDATNTYPLVDGKFMVALPGVGTGSATITLLSEMQPEEDINVELKVKLYVSSTKVSTTPDKLMQENAVILNYKIEKHVDPEISVEIVGDHPVCERDGEGVKISQFTFSGYVLDMPENCSLRATLYLKNANGGYTFTTLEMKDEESGLTIGEIGEDGKQTFRGQLQLTSFEEDMKLKIGSLSFRLNIEIVDEAGTVIESVPLHFVLIDARQ